ncbi:ATP-binding protein [Parabacteroides distasonis]|jgi:hypothetical protein|uniref:ATP-binding protein n=1 Tax=Parabacteroides distasonis TaxID=823 RepID=UPI0018AB811B|nr:ATP-binding protein [Parabacteroides distasonis]
MEKDVIKQIILRQQDFISQVRLLPRELEIEANGNYVFIGIRRAGKTYLLYQYIQELLRDGHIKQEILFINFEDERIADIRKDELYLLLECYKELFAYDPIIFLDEIQNVEGWEHFARRLADEKRRVFITGSNARMLSREIASTLGGRYLMKEVYPFDFSEYLRYHQVRLEEHWELSPTRADVVRLFEDYFYNGGLPESFDYLDKRTWLTSLYQKILYSDIVVRNNIRNERSLRLLVRKLADCVLQPMAVKRLQNILQGDGSRISRETVAAFLDYLHDAYLTFGISNFTETVSQRETTKKTYFYDNGLLNLFLFRPETKLLENLVAITLYKRYGEELYYYNKSVEVDFFVPAQGLAVQVSYALQDEQTRRREVGALIALSRFMPLRRILIICKDQEEVLEEGNLRIEVVPVWKWLLKTNLFQ